MLRVSVLTAHRRYRIRKERIAACVRGVLRGERRRKAVVTVILIDAHYSRKINRQFLGHDYSTDVLCFPYEAGPNLEGEIYVNLDRTRAQARAYGVPFMNELTRLAVHGTLHLVGYDDRLPVDLGRMRSREDYYTERFAGVRRKRDTR
jgi:rRNA maturation RNase YbeY